MRPKVKFESVSKQYSLFEKKSDKILDIFFFEFEKKAFFLLLGMYHLKYMKEKLLAL